MIKITITQKVVGKDPATFIREVTSRIHNELQNEIKLSADATAEIMRRILLNSGYKLEKLANAIQSKVLNDVNGIVIGIGKISDLPKDARGRDYWNAFNDGWLPPPNWGYWVGSVSSPLQGTPIANLTGERWVHTGDKSDFYMTPKKLIRPLKFVSIGYEDLKDHINKEIDKCLSRLK